MACNVSLFISIFYYMILIEDRYEGVSEDYVLKNLKPGTFYQMRLHAFNSYGNGSYASHNFTTIPTGEYFTLFLF